MERIIAALDSSERHVRARHIFQLMEEERKAGVKEFAGYSMLGIIAVANVKIVNRIREKLSDGASHLVDKAFEAVEKEDREAKRKEMEARIKAEEEAKKAKGKGK